MVRSFLPKFSSRSERRLLALCKNNPNNDADIEKWNKNAVQYIVKSLKKNLDIIDELERSISQECPDTKCVLLPKALDNRLLIAHRRGLPQVIYCRLWRWPDLQSHHQIKAIDKCISRAESIPTLSGLVGSPDVKTVCVNPYHYERKKPLPLEPVFVPCSRIPPDLSTSYEDSDPTGGGTRAISSGRIMSQQANINTNSQNTTAAYINPTNSANVGQNSPTAAVRGQENIQAEQLHQQQQQQQQQQQRQQQQQPTQPQQDSDDTVDFFSGLRPDQIPDVYYSIPGEESQQPALVMPQSVSDVSRQQEQQQPMHLQSQVQMPYQSQTAQQSQQSMQTQPTPSTQYQQPIHYQHQTSQQSTHVHLQHQHQPIQQQISQQQQQQQQQHQHQQHHQHHHQHHHQQQQQQHHQQQQQPQQQSQPMPQTIRTGQLHQHITTKTEIAHPYQFKQNNFARQHLSMHDPDPIGQQNYSSQPGYGPGSSYYPQQQQQTQPQHVQYQQQPPYSQQPGPLQPVQQMTSYGPPVYQTDYQMQQYQPQGGPQAQQQMQSEQMQLDHPMGQYQHGPMSDQQQPMIGSQILLAEIKYMEQSNWCSIFYNEYNIRVGERYQPRSPVVYVDGYTHPACADRYCVGGLSNVQRNEFTEWVRRRIGRGIKLSSVDGEVFVECLSEASIFVCAPIMYAEEEGAQAMERVIKVPMGSSMKVFSVHLFSRFLSTSIDMGFEACYKLTNFATFRVSFVKGWGKNYKRQKIPETPCWLEIQLNAPLSWLDRVLRTMKPPQGCGSTS